MTTVPRNRIALSALLVIVAGSGASFGACAAQTPQWRVPFSDLNLNTDAGVHALYGRIRIAAGRVCEASNPHVTASSPALALCAQAAVSRAVSAIGLPALALYEAQRNGKQPLLARQ